MSEKYQIHQALLDIVVEECSYHMLILLINYLIIIFIKLAVNPMIFEKDLF